MDRQEIELALYRLETMALQVAELKVSSSLQVKQRDWLSAEILKEVDKIKAQIK